MQASKSKLLELQSIITKMPLAMCYSITLPEFGVQWKEVSCAVRNARLPMCGGSVARVLCRHAKSLPRDELDDIVARLRLKLATTQPRTWHVIRLLDSTLDEPATVSLKTLPHRVLQALRNGKNRQRRPQVQSVLLNDLMYLSVQLVPDTKESSTLYVATPPGASVALVSSLESAKLLKAVAEGLGYARYKNADLHGKDIPSLLRISDQNWNANADQLADVPVYAPVPTLLPNGIDYTNRHYNDNYVKNIIGPNPPLLTELTIKTTKYFFDRTILNKKINVTVNIESENVAETLKSWVTKGALAPTSGLFQIFHQIKSNKITEIEDSD